MPSTIRTLIVDDEPLARRRIRTLLEREPDIQPIGECASGTEALEAIAEQHPDLVFLHIQMPGLDGLGVVAELEPEEMPVVVFVTAYYQYALRAFEAHALDDPFKPFEDERFAGTLDRAREQAALLRGARAARPPHRRLLEDLKAEVVPGARRDPQGL